MSAQMVSVVGSGGTTTGDGTGLLRAENDMLGLEQRAHELAQETGGGSLPIRHPVKFVQASASGDAQEHSKVSVIYRMHLIFSLTYSYVNKTSV